MSESTRRGLLRRAGAVAIGSAAMAAAPSVLPRAVARVGAGHRAWGAYVDPLGGDTTLAIRRFEDQMTFRLDAAATSLAAYREIGHRAYLS